MDYTSYKPLPIVRAATTAAVLVIAIWTSIISPAQAALGTPILNNPTTGCSGSSPFVSLSWTSVDGATEYDIFRDDTGAPIASVGTLTYDDFGVAPEENHTYYIRARSATETGPLSLDKSAVVPRCAPVLNTPGMVCAANGPTITLSWNVVPNVISYNILRGTSGAPIAIGANGPAQTSYSDATADGGTSYTYIVRAVWSDESKDSNQVSADTLPCPPALSGNADCGAPGARATLSWSTMRGAASFQLIRNGSFLTTPSGNSYDDTQAQQLSPYTYVTRVIYPNGTGDSNSLPLSIPRCPPVLAAQSTCNAANPTLPEVSLSWTATQDATIYNINEALRGFLGQLIGTPPPQIYTDGGVQNNITYRYTVEAQGPGFSNFFSNEAPTTPNCSVSAIPSPAPTLSAATACRVGDSQIDLSWTPANSTLYYTVDRTNNTSGATATWNISSAQTSTTDPNVETSASYSYKITAVGNGGTAPSNTATLSAVDCAPPSAPVLSAPTTICQGGQSAVNLSWTDSTNTTKYQIYRGGTLVTEINDTNAPSYAYQDKSVQNSTSYSYTITAVGPGGTATSNSGPITTLNCTVPTTPTLSISPLCQSSISSVSLSWTASANASYYDIWRKKPGAVSFSLFMPQWTGTSYQDQGVQPGGSYSYYVMAVGPGGSTPSNSLTTTGNQCPPGTPTFSTSPLCVGSTPAVDLSWKNSFALGYNLNEGSGSIATDASSNANNGTLTNGPTWTLGNNGYAVNFDGVNDYITVPNKSSLQITKNLTIEFWIKPTDFLQRRNPYAKSYGGEGSITIETNGQINYFYGTCGGNCSPYQQFTMTSALAANQWTHMALVRDLTGGKLYWYKNGVLVNQANASYSNAAASTGNVTIGYGYTGYYLKGILDDIRVYARALSQSEVQTDMSSSPGPESAIAQYNLTRNSAPLATAFPPASTYRDSDNLVQGQSYSYGITVTGPAGNSASVNLSTTTTICAVPGKPVVTLTPVCSNTTSQMRLNWGTTTNTVSYDVYRVPAVGSPTKLNASPLPSTQLTYTDVGPLTPNISYTYRVTANGPAGTGSTTSDNVSGTTIYCSPSRGTLTVTPQCSGSISQYSLSWTDATPANTSLYEINRDSVAIASTTLRTYIDNNSGAGFPSGEVHTFFIRTVGPTGLSTTSTSVQSTALPCGAPGAPTITAADAACSAGKAISLDGVNDYVSIADRPALRITGDVTVSTWLYINTQATNWVRVFGKGSSNARNYGLWNSGPTAAALFQIYNGTLSANAQSASGLMTPGQWHHLVGVKSGTNIYLYVNGVLRASSAISFTPPTSNDPVTVGYAGFYNYHNGLINEARVYNRAMNASEVAAEYARGAGQYGEAGTGLVGGWHLNEGSGTSVSDYSGTNANGSLLNGATWTDSSVATQPAANGSYPQVQVAWNAGSSVATYEVWRATTKLADIPVVDTLKNNYRYFDSFSASNNLPIGSQYNYQIYAVNGAGTKTPSATLQSNAIPECTPTKPQWNAGSPASSCSGTLSRASLSWTYAPPYGNTAKFRIKRNGAQIAEFNAGGAGSGSFIDDNSGAGLSAGTTYNYQVTAVSTGGLENISTTSSMTANTCIITLSPADQFCTLNGNGANGFNPVNLMTWTGDPAASSYYLYKQVGAVLTNQYIYNYNTLSSTTLREWLLLGSFANPGDNGAVTTYFNTDYIDQDPNATATETTIRPRTGEQTNGKIWTRYIVPQTVSYVDLQAALSANLYVLGYALTYVVAPKDMTGQLRLGSDDGIKAWVNGTLVLNNHVHRIAALDQNIVAISLKKGINTILLKVDQATATWGFYARLTNTSGQPLLSTYSSTESTVTNNQAPSYFVWSPSGITSNTVSPPPFSCAPGAPNPVPVPQCDGAQSTVEISWSQATNTTYYNIWRGTSLANLAPLGTSTTGTFYMDSDIESEKQYYYAIEAIGNGSTLSNAVATTTRKCAFLPAKPDFTADNIQATCVGTSPRMVLDWPDAENAISYTIHRNSVALSPSVTASAFTDGGVTDNTDYTYAIEATGTGGSTMSNPVTARSLICSGPPTPPTLDGISIVPPTHVYLTWTDRSANETGFRVHRSIITGNAPGVSPFVAALLPRPLAIVIANNLPANTIFYLDTTSQENTTYEYQIEAYNTDGQTLSNPLSIFVPIPPPGSFNLEAVCDFGNRQISLSWTPASTTAGGATVTYNAYWSQTGQTGTYALLDPPCSLDIANTSCTLDPPQSGHLFYKVIAKNTGGTTEIVDEAACQQPEFKEINP